MGYGKNKFKNRNMALITASDKMDWRSPTKVWDLLKEFCADLKDAPYLVDVCAHSKSIHHKADINVGKRFKEPPRELTHKGARKLPYDPSAMVMSHAELLKYSNSLYTRWTHKRKQVAFANPPYGRALVLWARKAAYEARQRQPNEHIILLVPARVGTAWFQDLLVPTATVLLFVRGALHFDDAANAAPFHSLIYYAGDRPKQFIKTFGHLGWYIQFIAPKHKPASTK